MNKKILTLTLTLTLVACAQSMERRLGDVRTDFASGEFRRQEVGDRNLDPLLAGNKLFQQGQYNRADEVLESMNIRIASSPRANIPGEVVGAVAGQMARNYTPWFMDDLFISYYQLWAALATGRWADARVIINQSYAKQQRLSAEYRRLLDRRERDAAGLGAHLRAENAHWQPFADIMNPALTYLAGIYFLNFARGNNDFETARTYLLRADGMVPGNSKIRADLALARARHAPQNTTWIFIESGFAPRLYERRIDWPFATMDGVRMISIATPGARRMTPARRVDGAEIIADVDRMFMTEFNEYSVNDALRAFAAAIAQLQIQRVAADQSPWLGLAATVGTFALTSAEIRSWVTLPQHISVIRKTTPTDGLIPIKSGGNVLTTLTVPSGQNNLVYIRKVDNNIITTKIITLN